MLGLARQCQATCGLAAADRMPGAAVNQRAALRALAPRLRAPSSASRRTVRMQAWWNPLSGKSKPAEPASAPAADSSPRVPRVAVQEAPAGQPGSVGVAEAGWHTQKGTSRKQNEDRLVADVADEASAPGVPFGYAAVFDGHGGNATAEWLQSNLLGYIEEQWQGGNSPEACITKAFLQADKTILQPKGGVFGMMGERGIGGSKCGATAAVTLLYTSPKGGSTLLLTANVGDARTLLVRGNEVLQLSEDHVPDSEQERIRIERQNPNAKMPLVRYVGDTWRVGGLLALSRAFGDAYMKGTGQFEGVSAGSDGYSSGFGVIAEPYTQVIELTSDDRWLVVSSDGLFSNQERGGGGGLSNQQVMEMCDRLASKGCEAIAKELASKAVQAGTTDDVSVVVLRLKSAD